jgi:hypothetical protein
MDSSQRETRKFWLANGKQKRPTATAKNSLGDSLLHLSLQFWPGATRRDVRNDQIELVQGIRDWPSIHGIEYRRSIIQLQLDAERVPGSAGVAPAMSAQAANDGYRTALAIWGNRTEKNRDNSDWKCASARIGTGGVSDLVPGCINFQPAS